MMRTLPLLLFCCACFQCYAQLGEWTWMKGDTITYSAGVYGTQGVADIDNTPPSLYGACSWVDTVGNLWLFGGTDANGNNFNTLWKYDPGTNEWTWINGLNTGNPYGVYGTQGIPAAANTPGSRAYGFYSWTDHSGKFWLYGGYGYNDVGSYGPLSDLWKYDPATNEWAWIQGSKNTYVNPVYGTFQVANVSNTPGYRIESCIAWVDSASNLWLYGGRNYGDYKNDVWRYDVPTNSWAWMAGSSGIAPPASYGTKGVFAASNTPGGRLAYCKWTDLNHKFWLFGGGENDGYADLWEYDPSINQWSWISGSNVINAVGNYDALCSTGQNFYPAGRTENRGCWTDTCGRLWLFGGARTINGPQSMSDLWVYDIADTTWSWVKGPHLFDQYATWGTMGISSPLNNPPAKEGSTTWTDANGNLWLFGGGFQSWFATMNDLWRFTIDPSCPLASSCPASNTSSSAFTSSDTSLCEKFCLDFFDQSTNSPIAWLWEFPGGIPSTSTDQNPANICYQTPGTYDVTLITTSASGNDTITLLDYITVYATPPFPTISQSGYTLTSSTAITYQWQFNSVDISGATNQSYDATQTGYYSVIITDQNGCVSATTVYVLIEGINDISNESSLFVSPNPSDGNFTVEFSNAESGNDLSIEVFNTLGQKVFSSLESSITGSNKNFKTEIHLNTVARGVYLLQIKTGDVFLVKKLMVVGR